MYYLFATSFMSEFKISEVDDCTYAISIAHRRDLPGLLSCLLRSAQVR